MSMPLHGLRVLELARILAGPWAGQILADLGADVVKVERPGGGDDTRGWGPPFVEGSDGAKRIGRLFPRLQSRQALGRRRFRDGGGARACPAARCARRCPDRELQGRWTEAPRPRLRQPSQTINPRLVYCSITGFGQDGPYAHRAGYDLMIQGMGGIMDLTGEPGRRAAEDRRRLCRHLHRGLFRRRDPRRAPAPRRDRRGLPYRHVAPRHAGQRARQPGPELPRVGHPAAADGKRASEHRALSGAAGLRRPHDRRGRQRPAVRALRRKCSARRSSRPIRASCTTPTA